MFISEIKSKVQNTFQKVIQSMSPLTFHHPAHSILDKWRSGCKENGENLFKSFYPQT